MPKPKTRVVVNYENADRALFSVRENGDQSLTVIIKESTNYEDPKDGDIQIKRHKFSIHVSPSSPGTTISRALLLANGRTNTSAQFIKDSKESLFCLIFGTLSPDLGLDRYLAQPRARDRVIRIGTFHKSDLATLIYHIVVCDHQNALPFVPGHTLTVATFSKWKIGIFSTFLNLPCTGFGRFYSPATRPPKTDGVFDPDYPEHLLQSHGADSLPASDLKDLLLEMNNQLSARLMLKFCDALPDSQKEQRDLMMNHQFWFHPTVQSLFAARLGAAPGQIALAPSIFIRR
jgi:hypothetical protein